MKAIQLEHHGGPDALELKEIIRCAPGDGQVAVDVADSGVNFIDTYQRSGAYPGPLPFVPGLEGSGFVAEVGDGHKQLLGGPTGGLHNSIRRRVCATNCDRCR